MNPRRTTAIRLLLLLEYVALFLALPASLATWGRPIPLFPLLWTLTSLCLVYLCTRRDFERSRLWSKGAFRPWTVSIWLPFLLAAPLLALWAAVAEPQLFFRFVRERPALWAVVMILYPALSAYPQGIIYRSFIFRRYRPLFGERWGAILASAVAFAAAHLIFRNWIAPTLGFAGGLLFAWTYARTQSALPATIQHALFGCWLFTVGLGWYFFYGAVEF